MLTALENDALCDICKEEVRASKYICPNCKARHHLVIKNPNARLFFIFLVMLGGSLLAFGLLNTFYAYLSPVIVFFSGVIILAISYFMYNKLEKASKWYPKV